MYRFIRDHGDFENWDLVVLGEYKNIKKVDLFLIESDYIKNHEDSVMLLNSKMNSILTEDEKKRKKKIQNDAMKEGRVEYDRLRYLDKKERKRLEMLIMNEN